MTGRKQRENGVSNFLVHKSKKEKTHHFCLSDKTRPKEMVGNSLVNELTRRKPIPKSGTPIPFLTAAKGREQFPTKAMRFESDRKRKTK